jgi:hypothetical protein
VDFFFFEDALSRRIHWITFEDTSGCFAIGALLNVAALHASFAAYAAASDAADGNDDDDEDPPCCADHFYEVTQSIIFDIVDMSVDDAEES